MNRKTSPERQRLLNELAARDATAILLMQAASRELRRASALERQLAMTDQTRRAAA